MGQCLSQCRGAQPGVGFEDQSRDPVGFHVASFATLQSEKQTLQHMDVLAIRIRLESTEPLTRDTSSTQRVHQASTPEG